MQIESGIWCPVSVIRHLVSGIRHPDVSKADSFVSKTNCFVYQEPSTRLQIMAVRIWHGNSSKFTAFSSLIYN